MSEGGGRHLAVVVTTESCLLQVLQNREDMGVRLPVQQRGKEGGVARAAHRRMMAVGIGRCGGCWAWETVPATVRAADGQAGRRTAAVGGNDSGGWAAAMSGGVRVTTMAAGASQ
jgi:hypothetical protein